MSHAVHFRDVAGEVHLEDLASLEAALERVEHLRNDDGATEVRVFREVPIEVRTYYRVTAAAEPLVAVADPDGPGTTDAPATGEPAAEVLTPAAVIEPPSGAMLMSPPPVSAVPDPLSHEDAEAAADAHAGESRRPRFSRS